jgi:hypothetical protein
VTTKFDSASLLHSTPTGKGITLTDWYIYQRHKIIQHIDPDDGDGDVGFQLNAGTTVRAREFWQNEHYLFIDGRLCGTPAWYSRGTGPEARYPDVFLDFLSHLGI